MEVGLTDMVKNGYVGDGGGCGGELLACIQSKLLFVSHEASAWMLMMLVFPGVVSGSVYEPTRYPSKYP
jgi:hypothetical protein